MTVELWIPFTLAAALILIIPGPTILLVISQAVAHGRKSVVPPCRGRSFGRFHRNDAFSFGTRGADWQHQRSFFAIFKWIGRALPDLSGGKALEIKSGKQSGPRP